MFEEFYRHCNIVQKQNKKLKYTYIKILDHQTIEIRSPKLLNTLDLQSMILRKHLWIQKVFAKFQTKQILKAQPRLFGNALLQEISNCELERLYIQEIEWFIDAHLKDIAYAMGLKFQSYEIKKYKTMWGCCTKDNILKFNLYLAQFDPKVIRYVFIHELAHIKHKHHKKSFWEYVAKFEPDYKRLRNQLKISVV